MTSSIVPSVERRWLTTREAAEMLGFAPHTLRRWRGQGKGPAWVRVSDHAIRYAINEIERFMRDRTSTPIAA